MARTINVNQLVHQGSPLEEVKYVPEHLFQEFPLNAKLKANLASLGYTDPTEIQERTFLQISEIKDVIGVATTGTGKTGAFLIPLINSLLFENNQFQTLVMVPTRELALQVEEEFRKLTKKMNLHITSLIGGQSVGQDIKKLRKPSHFIVGTPGRLTDLCKRGILKLNTFSVLVLDEFDRMLDMGFTEDVNFLTGQMGNRDQTLLFSATIDGKQKNIIEKLMNNPVEIKVSSGNTTADHINQDVVYAKPDEKLSKLMSLVNEESFEKVLVFAETKRNVGKVTKSLKQSGIHADEIHGDKTQGYRIKALKNFKNGKLKVLVATDVAARGLDISNVTHVINFDMPQNYETYIHRIGRTGRAGKAGNALTFVN